MNFCAAILILKVEEDTQHFWCIMFYYTKEGKNTTEMQKKKKTCVVYGESPMTDWMYQKWFAKFHARDFLLDDAPWSGGPVEVDSD